MSDESEQATRHCLDLFSGLGGFSTAFADKPDWEVTTVDVAEEFNPDVQADVLNLRPSDLRNPDVVIASPPCTAFSMAASGTHLDADGSPVSEWGAESLALVHHTVGLIAGLDPDWWVVENPMGGMRKVLGQPDAHVWWCQYGANRAKPTDLWGNLPPSFEPRRCHNGNDDCHHEPAPRGSDAGTQRSDRSAPERAKIPRKLSESILKSVESPEPEQTRLTEVR
jgi:hypothetical protein